MRAQIFVGMALTALASLYPPDASSAEVVEYSAEYEVRYKGRRVASAEFSVTADASGEYAFRSHTKARGIWRLASPKPAVELSRFIIDDDLIAPIHFAYEDGSRSGDDNYAVEFDSSAGEIRVSGPGGTSQYPYERGLLDRGSLQVALMRDLGSCVSPGPYRYVDDDGIRSYSYDRLEDLETDTGLGTLKTVRFSQQREGSSRTTILWLAPELAYLPVRIEQIRDGEVETVFTLDDANGIERTSTDCSSLG